MRKVCLALTLLALVVLTLSPAFAAERKINLVNAMEIDRTGNTFGGASLINNGRPLGIGERFEAGFVQNTGSRPVVLALSNGRILKLDAGEAALVDAGGTPVYTCVCMCGSETFPPFSDTTSAACAGHNGQRCTKSDGSIGTLGNCDMTWVPATADAPSSDHP